MGRKGIRQGSLTRRDKGKTRSGVIQGASSKKGRKVWGPEKNHEVAIAKYEIKGLLNGLRGEKTRREEKGMLGRPSVTIG